MIGSGGHGSTFVTPAFLELPKIVYREDPTWIPEDTEAVARAFSRRNGFYGRGVTETFCIPGKVRVAAFFDPNLIISGEKVAYFGYFESIGDTHANSEVFAQVEAWAKRNGVKKLYGPIQFNTFGGYRLRLNVEPGGLPFLGEPYNPETYPAMLEGLGFCSHQEYVTQLIPIDRICERMSFLFLLREEFEKEGYRFEQMTPELWLDNLSCFYEMLDATFGQNFAYSRPSYDTFTSIFGPNMMRRLCIHGSVLVIGPLGEPAAFGLAFPHYGPLTTQGRTGPKVLPKDLDYHIHRPLLSDHPPRGIVAKTLGVHPSHRRKGLMEALLYHSFESLMKVDYYDFWYAALIRTDNYSRKMFATTNVGERTYALYAKTLEDPR